METETVSALPAAIEALRRTPGMMVQDASFSSICAFLEGYDQALNRCFLVGFREWLVIRLGSGSNFWWPELIRRIAEPRSVPAEMLLFELLAEFLEERSQHDGLRKIFRDFEACAAK
jgi:hypothetical protein